VGTDAGALGDQVAHPGIERLLRVAGVVAATPTRKRRPLGRPQQSSRENLVELAEVEVEHEHAVAERVVHRDAPAMVDGARVDAAMPGH